MLWPFKKIARPAFVDFTPVPPDPEWKPAPLNESTHQGVNPPELIMRTAEWHAFQAQRIERSGDELEALEHLKDAGEFLAQVGGPLRPKSAEEIYQWCAARRALEV